MYNHFLRLIKADPVASRLDALTIHRLAVNEEIVAKIERKYDNEADRVMNRISKRTIEAFRDGKTPDMDDLGDLFAEQYFETAFKAIKVARSETELEKTRRLGPKVPKSFEDLKKAYDSWKKKGELPPKQKKFFEKLKKAYLKKCKTAWDKYGESFRTGETPSTVVAQDKIREIADTTASRAKTIVRTETTSGYNATRKAYFDSSKDVTHYLFLAIRDARTSNWCTHKTIAGKRGRHGLVYSKDDPLCDKETPACHWNCRSTMVPLTPLNPSHLRLIQDSSIQRRNVSCYPLPVGWKSAA